MPFDGKLLVKLICSSRAVRSAKGFGTLALGPDNRAGVFLKEKQRNQCRLMQALCSVQSLAESSEHGRPSSASPWLRVL